MKLKEKHYFFFSIRIKKTSTRLAILFKNEQLQIVSIFDRVDTQALKKMMKKTYSNLQSTRKVRSDAMNDYQKKLTIFKERILSDYVIIILIITD